MAEENGIADTPEKTRTRTGWFLSPEAGRLAPGSERCAAGWLGCPAP